MLSRQSGAVSTANSLNRSFSERCPHFEVHLGKVRTLVTQSTTGLLPNNKLTPKVRIKRGKYWLSISCAFQCRKTVCGLSKRYSKSPAFRGGSLHLSGHLSNVEAEPEHWFIRKRERQALQRVGNPCFGIISGVVMNSISFVRKGDKCYQKSKKHRLKYLC